MVLDSTMIKLLIPVIIFQVVLIVLALVDLSKREKVTGDSKLLWSIIIVLFQIIGPLVYFVIGRKD